MLYGGPDIDGLMFRSVPLSLNWALVAVSDDTDVLMSLSGEGTVFRVDSFFDIYTDSNGFLDDDGEFEPFTLRVEPVGQSAAPPGWSRFASDGFWFPIAGVAGACGDFNARNGPKSKIIVNPNATLLVDNWAASGLGGTAIDFLFQTKHSRCTGTQFTGAASEFHVDSFFDITFDVNVCSPTG